MKSKTIIISSQDGNTKGRGILTLYQEDDLLKCRLRLYNIEKLNRFCKLGVYHQNEVFSANLLEKNGSYTSSMVGDFDIDKDFYTAIIDTANNNNVILSGGTYAGFFFNDQSVFENKNEHVFDNIEKENPNTNLYNYKYDDTANLMETSNFAQDNTISAQQTDIDKCKDCKYKEFFYSCQQNDLNVSDQISLEEDKEEQSPNQNISTSLEEPPTTLYSAQTDKKESSTAMLSEVETSANPSNKEQQTSILSALIPQFQYVFDNYQADEILNGLIPNSKFVKINENQDQYSIGAIYEEDKMKYICYAVMRDYNSPVPQELGTHYQWLPLDKEDPLSEGYFIVFQDANDLKIVEL